MRRPTKTHILTSCREARIETCQANPLPTWKTDLFTHESLSLLRLYWRPFSTHRTYLLLKTLQQHLVGVRCGSVPFRSSTGLTARLTHVRGVAKNILDLTRKTFRKKYNDWSKLGGEITAAYRMSLDAQAEKDMHLYSSCTIANWPHSISLEFRWQDDTPKTFRLICVEQ